MEEPAHSPSMMKSATFAYFGIPSKWEKDEVGLLLGSFTVKWGYHHAIVREHGEVIFAVGPTGSPQLPPLTISSVTVQLFLLGKRQRARRNALSRHKLDLVVLRPPRR